MGWQKDKIEELAEELGIDGGDSWSQQDRLRKIAKEVGMDEFNGISNADTDELEARLKEKQTEKSQKEINEENNEKNLRAAAKVLKNKGIPYASAIAKGIDKADKISGGKSTKILAKNLNKANKITPGGRMLQRNLNKVGQSGNSSIKPTFIDNNDGKGTFEIKIPLKIKIILIAAIIGGILLALMLFVTLFGGDLGAANTGAYAYGQTCPIITIVDTDCDENGSNCTNQYNESIDYETYIAGVVAAEVGHINSPELYKLMAVIARTYTQKNIGGDCTISGNSSFLNYTNVEENYNANNIKEAVSDTEGELILIDDLPINPYFTNACVVGKDNSNYYIRYGSKTLPDPEIQTISKKWDLENGNKLGSLYILANNNSNTDYFNNRCPLASNDYGLSIIGAQNLIDAHNYSYTRVIDYYYGDESEVVENSIMLTGAKGYVNPVMKIYCTSPFGKRDNPTVEGTNEQNHTGLDMSLETGEPIFAAKSGTVVSVEKKVKAINNCDYGYGNYVKIRHDDGTETLYAHMKYRSIKSKIAVGYRVTQGEQIGQAGSTGCSTGSHLHYEVRVDGDFVDPTDYMDLSNAQGTCTQ